MNKSQIKYIEYKGDDLEGPGRIGRVTFSKTGKTIYYGGKQFQSLKGGYKANFFDVDTGENYWISGCKKAGNDTLYSGFVEIDADVQEEYWTKIRGLPERVGETQFRTLGKYGR
jgi:hypothetical protein